MQIPSSLIYNPSVALRPIETTRVGRLGHLRSRLAFLIFCLLTLSIAVQAQFTYTITNGSITITGYTGPGGDLVIPTMIDGLPVTRVGDAAFWESYSLTNLTIPAGVIELGDSAFSNCSNLTSVIIGPNVLNIGGSAFDDCTSLATVEIPNSVTNIDMAAFSSCTSLTNVVIPNGVIGYFAFDSCTRLTSVTIGDGVTDIRYSAFWNSTSLETLTVVALNLKFSSLDGVLFTKDRTTLLRYPLARVGGYDVPDSVTNIDNQAFSGCTHLTTIGLGTNLSSIGALAFEFCSSLTNVFIPNSVTGIGSGPFYCCTKLAMITVDPLNRFYTSVDGVLFDKPQTKLLQYPPAKAGGYAVPDTVTNIEFTAFENCSAMTSIGMGTNVESLGIFRSCASLTNVTIGPNVSRIEDHAFDSCSNLTDITIPSRITYLGDYAFFLCTKLANVALSTNITRIGSYAFESCSNLVNIRLPQSVTNIGPNAFENCRRLSSIAIPGSVLMLQPNTFFACLGLTNLTLGEGISSIGKSAFQYCSGLTNLTIPSSVTNIGSDAISWCTKLGAIYFKGNAPTVTSPLPAIRCTSYYLPGTTGWTSTLWANPAVLWNPTPQTTGSNFGVRNNRFGFAITGTPNIPLVVEISTNPAAGVWQPVQSCLLTNGYLYFRDSNRNFPAGFYRIRSP